MSRKIQKLEDLFDDNENIKKSVILRPINCDAQMNFDLMTGKGFMINKRAFNDVYNKIKNIDGPRSIKFGSGYGDDFSFMERYHCECGEIIGAMFEGEECPLCHTKVEYSAFDITKTGWLYWGPYKVIHPRYYKILESVIGSKNLDNIIRYDNMYDQDGNTHDIHEEIVIKSRRQLKKMNQYYNIGLIQFYENFDEIITAFGNKKNPERVENLINNKEYIWTSCFPVYSTCLRPISINNGAYSFTSIDKHINPICSSIELLPKFTLSEVVITLYSIQNHINKIWDEVFKLIKGKNGHIRSSILGGNYNYSSRNVITLDPTLQCNEIDIGFPLATVFYKNWLIKEIMNDKKVPLFNAYNYLQLNSNDGNEYLYELCDRILEKYHPKILINRNPSLNYESFQLMNIRRINKDPNNYCMALGYSPLPGLHADFDGDTLNLFSIPFPELQKVFENYDPLYYMGINAINNKVAIKINPFSLLNLNVFLK